MITEALLEMHYQASIVELFEKTFGKKFLRLIKPSPQNEKWVGFDQGWTHINVSENEIFKELKNSLEKSAEECEKLYLGYFFQFKKMQIMKNKRKDIPCSKNKIFVPYYRSEISLEKNKITKVSQHDTLIRLSKIKNALVYYACPMLFDTIDVYEKADLKKLQLVPVDKSTPTWKTKSHFIVFQTQGDNSPKWCSEDPIEGEAFRISEILTDFKLSTPKEFDIFLKETRAIFKLESTNGKSHYPESLTILEFENKN